ncbi:uncharacterized protein IL334_000108 [Kwoniella shivajii]|uniref:Peroxin-7 n=1 Tax=Kwoniella shivajii TaxID=564305 RepID=A0ABZ1CN77_9TREE|nr:hypothetical protein IL334_000108 [Kwoniella shivajii]
MNTSRPYLRLKTPQFSHHNISFSPYFENRLALASGANFGLVGNGRIHIIDLDPNIPGGLKLVRYFETRDCVFDIAWSESHENQIVAACGNGAIKMFDVTLEGLPIKSWHEHSAEIMSIEWNNLQKDTFVTSSWDQTIKIWTSSRSTSLLTIQAHQGQIYNATFSPHSPSILATCSSDGLINIFDLRSQSSSSSSSSSSASASASVAKPALSIPAGISTGTGGGFGNPIEILSCDWNKYDPNLLASSDKNGSIKLWDMRSVSNNVNGNIERNGRQIGKHHLATRKIAWSPHKRDIIASTGYDMTCKVWNINSPNPIHVHSEHTEFVMGINWALFDPGLLASAAWDEEVHLYRV